MPDNHRFTAVIEDDFVVFLIGVRINKLARVDRWLPVVRAMQTMLTELSTRPDTGLLGHRTRWGGRHIEVIQYWRSLDQLLAYAQEPNSAHLPAWARFNRSAADNPCVGIWHETYVIGRADYETVYRHMPAHGLGAATRLVPARGRLKTAAGRLHPTRE